jgi:6,7-dimethyl-8-ribityllumazine synthase
MKSSSQNFTKITLEDFPNLKKNKIGIVVSEWNKDITSNLLNGAQEKLIEFGIKNENIKISWVPGSFELVYGCKELSKQNLDAIIAIGCVIKGETDHYDFICNAVSNGIMQLNISYSIPVIFCVLTDHNKNQSLDRSGGKLGNKGAEAAIAALKMISFK